VAVSYRKPGEPSWHEGMPLARLHGEQIYGRNTWNLVAPNMFAGSVLDLEPGTAYEVRFVMSDPDGVGGVAADATKVLTVRTRPEPKPAEGGKVYHVYPTKWKGPKTEPSFEGIMCAYNYFEGLTFRNTDIAIWGGTQFRLELTAGVGAAGPRGRNEQGRARDAAFHDPRRIRPRHRAGSASRCSSPFVFALVFVGVNVATRPDAG